MNDYQKMQKDNADHHRKIIKGDTGKSITIYKNKEELRDTRITADNEIHTKVGGKWRNSYVEPHGLRKIRVGHHDHDIVKESTLLDKVLENLGYTSEEPIKENFRELAKQGIGAHSKAQATKLTGQVVDYYHPQTGDKREGKIGFVGKSHYIVKDHKTKDQHHFSYTEDAEGDALANKVAARAKLKNKPGALSKK